MNDKYKATIKVFDRKTNILVDEDTFYYGDLIKKYSPKKYVYTLSVFENENFNERVHDKHFGVGVSSFGSLRFSVDEYANRYFNRNVYKGFWSGSFAAVIDQYVSIKKYEVMYPESERKYFKKDLQKYLDEHPFFTEINDLNTVNKISGIYMLILDDYKFIYIGQAKDMKRRIMAHWSKNDYYSGRGIDLYKAFDTTRIYVVPASDQYIDMFEYTTTNDLDDKYKLNMFSGGTVEFFEKEKIDSIHVNIRTVPYGTDEYKKYRSFIKSLYDQYRDVLVKR